LGGVEVPLLEVEEKVIGYFKKLFS
jgi:hypothetical protein